MSDKIWRFQGQLQENENRVITSASGTVSEINQGETPSLDIKSENGQLYIDLKVPTKKVESFDIGGVGQQFTIDGSPTSANGQNYGEIFNDYTNNTAGGLWSHAVGYGSKADYPYQAVFGKFNDNKKNNVFEIGYGNNTSNRNNIFEVDKEGNVVIDGDITNGKGISLNSLDSNKLDKVQFDYLVSESQPRIHRLTNKDIITVTTTETVLVNNEDFLTTTATNPLFWATVAFTLSTNAIVTFKYYLDGVLQSDDTIVETYTAGAHFASLFNVYEMEENYSGTLKVTMTVSAGTATINEYAFKGALYIQGVGITAAFAGKLKFTDGFGLFNINPQPVSALSFRDRVQIETGSPINNGLIDRVQYLNVRPQKISMCGFTDTFGTNVPIVNNNYVLDVSKSKFYQYDKDNILIKDSAFVLNTDYEYVSEIQETDFGKVSILEIKTDDKLQIESVVIESNG